MPETTGAGHKKYDKKMTAMCIWCCERFETNHGNAMTCGQRCRSRLARFRKLAGFDPESPPGPVTAQVAFRKLVEGLLKVERLRRNQRQQLSMTPFHQRDRMERELDAELVAAQKRWVG